MPAAKANFFALEENSEDKEYLGDQEYPVHVDLVGPLPESEGRTYLFTVVDRFSCFAVAIPLSDISEQAVPHLSGVNGVAGILDDFTSDGGSQFSGQFAKGSLEGQLRRPIQGPGKVPQVLPLGPR